MLFHLRRLSFILTFNFSLFLLLMIGIQNSSTKKKTDKEGGSDNKTRKKREELSVFASRSIKKENIEIVVSFN